MGSVERSTNDRLGARVIRRRLVVRFLDAMNLPGGVNPTACPAERFPHDEFVVDVRATGNKHIIEFTVAARCELESTRIAVWVITQMCGWQNKGRGRLCEAARDASR
ncbi:hypothetical protein WA016_01197 [Myxococcus stipitatus]